MTHLSVLRSSLIVPGPQRLCSQIRCCICAKAVLLSPAPWVTGRSRDVEHICSWGDHDSSNSDSGWRIAWQSGLPRVRSLGS